MKLIFDYTILPTLLFFLYTSTQFTYAQTLNNQPITPLNSPGDINSKKADLGRALFFEKALSADNSISCASCHDLANGGDDGSSSSTGINGQIGPINSPTVYNASLQFRQFWDGRATDLHQQADGPVTNPIEMGSEWPQVLAKLYDNPKYPGWFNSIYEDGISQNNVKDAIAEFERTLITENSPFDQYLRGDEAAITTQQKRGYRLFKEYGCSSCHQGANVGGNMFQLFGVLNNYFLRRGQITDADMGRFNVTGNELDRHVFKVPSLRMAKYTAPYFHDGSQKTLKDAVDAMFLFQLGREAPESEKLDIVSFIESLAGQHRELKP